MIEWPGNGNEHLIPWDKQIIQQHPQTPDVLRPLFEVMSPFQLLEIGTGSGAFAYWLSQFGLIVSCDLVDRRIYRENYTFHQRDYRECYDAEYDIIICDGGNKYEEIEFLIAQKYDGLVLGHDYGHSEWPYCEWETPPPGITEIKGQWNRYGWFIGKRNEHSRIDV